LDSFHPTRICFAGLLLLGLLAAGCNSGGGRSPAIGEAYAGPMTLVLRQDINPRSAVAGTVHHGQRLEILQQRRRFIKVRSADGKEGWTEERLLLSTVEIGRLRHFNEQARNFPSQGVATTYDDLNIHTEPSRFSPSFIQVKSGEKFDVIGHLVAPRKPAPRKPLVVAPSKPVRIKKEEKKPKIAPPPSPPAPKPPPDWLEMSKTNLPDDDKQAEAEPTDDWSLVRTSAGQSGWVLTRRVFMAIPDDVAQYAEGRRITSYIALNDVRDGDQVKRNWFWTTVEQSLEPYDFDSYRVFVWSLRRHRYETGYIQRRVKGYFPVLAEAPGFSVCLENKDGQFARRMYSFTGNLVRPAGVKPCQPHSLEQPSQTNRQLLAQAQPEQNAPAPSVYDRVKNRLRTWRKRWFNR
jgi:hypothetical protein